MSVLNNVPCIVRATIIDMNFGELKYYPFMISINKCLISTNMCSKRNKRHKCYSISYDNERR